MDLTVFSPVLLGDIFGFLAIILIGSSAVFMLVRARLLRVTKNLALLRITHMVVSALGGLFLVLHVGYFLSYPLGYGIVIGYLAFAISAAVWLTGTAFLEKVRDSLFFHGTLSVLLIAVVLVHAASTSANMSSLLSNGVLVTTAGIALANASYHAHKASAHK